MNKQQKNTILKAIYEKEERLDRCLSLADDYKKSSESDSKKSSEYLKEALAIKEEVKQLKESL